MCHTPRLPLLQTFCYMPTIPGVHEWHDLELDRWKTPVEGRTAGTSRETQMVLIILEYLLFFPLFSTLTFLFLPHLTVASKLLGIFEAFTVYWTFPRKYFLFVNRDFILKSKNRKKKIIQVSSAEKAIIALKKNKNLQSLILRKTGSCQLIAEEPSGHTWLILFLGWSLSAD